MTSKIKIYFFGLILTLFVLSCNKRLDVNPTQSIDELQALRTSSDVEAALVGAYADLGTADLYGGDVFVYSELLANNNGFNWTGTFQELTQIYNKAIPVDNAFVASTWLRAYQTINDVNNVLDALPVVVDARKSAVEGEAKFIRGSLYFELVKLYAKAWNDGDPAANDGVPIVLTPTRAPLDATAQLPRDKVSAVYAQAIKDLTAAEAMLPEVNGVFANTYAAAAMLARLYLQQGDYANAAAAADRVISSGAYELEKNYADVFPFNQDNLNEDVGSPDEYIFSMQVTSSQGVNDFNTYFSPYGRGDIDITEDHLQLYEAGDDRLNIFYDDGGIFRTGKFDMVYGNVPVIRLAELYLVRAEANFRLGTSVGAEPVKDINTIRARVGLTPYTPAQLTLENILTERKLELAFEGQALHDIKRVEGTVGIFPWDSPKLIFPIPSREIKVNASLTQNEGY